MCVYCVYASSQRPCHLCQGSLKHGLEIGDGSLSQPGMFQGGADA